MGSPPSEMFERHPVAFSRDVDHAREALSTVYLPVEFPAARASDSFEMQFNALAVGSLTVGYMRFASAVHIETAMAEHYHIDIPTAGRATMSAGLGSQVYATQSTAGRFMPGRPAQIDSDDQFAQISLMIRRGRLQLELENLLGLELKRPLEFDGEIDLTTAITMHEVLRLIDTASRQDHGMLTNALSTQRLEQVLIHSLLLAQPHNYSAALERPSPASGECPVSQAVELLRTRPEYPWPVAELAFEVAVSVRSLQEGFRRSLDTTPMAYLRRLRCGRCTRSSPLRRPARSA